MVIADPGRGLPRTSCVLRCPVKMTRLTQFGNSAQRRKGPFPEGTEAQKDGHWFHRLDRKHVLLIWGYQTTASDRGTGRITMQNLTRRAFAAASFALMCAALPVSAQEIVRIQGTIERVEGPIFVVKNRDGAEVKLTVTDNPLFVAIVKSTMADIKPGMFVGSTGIRQPKGDRGAHLPGIDAGNRRRSLRLGPQAAE